MSLRVAATADRLENSGGRGRRRDGTGRALPGSGRKHRRQLVELPTQHVGGSAPGPRPCRRYHGGPGRGRVAGRATALERRLGGRPGCGAACPGSGVPAGALPASPGRERNTRGAPRTARWAWLSPVPAWNSTSSTMNESGCSACTSAGVEQPLRATLRSAAVRRDAASLAISFSRTAPDLGHLVRRSMALSWTRARGGPSDSAAAPRRRGTDDRNRPPAALDHAQHRGVWPPSARDRSRRRPRSG